MLQLVSAIHDHDGWVLEDKYRRRELRSASAVTGMAPHYAHHPTTPPQNATYADITLK